MSKHKVKTHNWNNGILETLDHFFDDLRSANLFANNIEAHTVKVYDPDGNLLTSKSSASASATYA
jgi:hypothetical protein